MRKKRYNKTFLTEEEVRILDALLKHEKVTDAAKELGRAQSTVSTIKKRIEEKISMAIETVKLALNKGLIDREKLLELINTIETYSGPEEKEKKARKRVIVEKESEEENDVIKKVKEELQQRATGLLNTLDLISRSKYGIGAIDLLLNDPHKFIELVRSHYSSEDTIYVITRYFIRPIFSSSKKQELEKLLELS